MNLDMIGLGQAIISGLLMGGMYSAVTVGFSLTWGVTKVINLAHPVFALIGSYISYWGLRLLSIDPLMSLLIIVPLFFFLGVISHRVLFKPLSARSNDLTASSMIMTFGLVIVLENIILIICKADPRLTSPAYSGKSLFIDQMALPITALVSFGLAIVSLAAIYLFLHRTYLGKAVRAVWQEKEGAKICGINIDQVTDITYGVSFASAGVGGVCMGLAYSIDPAIHSTWLIYLFMIAVVGGVGSIRGVAAASLILGLIMGLAGFFLPYVWINLILFGLLLTALLVKPKGLFQR
jgi:branched-chain amino acid transport system permease protein